MSSVVQEPLWKLDCRSSSLCQILYHKCLRTWGSSSQRPKKCQLKLPFWNFEFLKLVHLSCFDKLYSYIVPRWAEQSNTNIGDFYTSTSQSCSTSRWSLYSSLYQNSVNHWRARLLLNIAYFTALHAVGSWLAINAICRCFYGWICAVCDSSSASQEMHSSKVYRI